MEKKITAGSLIIQGIFYLLLALLCFNRSLYLWSFIYFITLAGGTALCAIQLYDLIKHTMKFTSFIKFTATAGCVLYVFFHPDRVAVVVPWIVGWYALLIAFIQSINYYVYRKDSLRGTFWRFVLFLVSLVFGLILVLNPLDKLQFLSTTAGIWLLFYGIVTWVEAGKQLISETTQKKLNKHMNISVPILISALIPIRAFSSISGLGHSVPLKKKADSDIEVNIYLKGTGFEQLGHVDITVDDIIYSYGLHDPEHRKLNGTYGDGVLIVADRYSFLKEHLQTEDKLIVSYGISLNKKQKHIVNLRINELLNRTIPWKCAYQLKINDANDYASRVAKAASCQMYKFTHRKFKTYFVFSTNCVLLADHLLRCDELDLFDFHGMVTPGSYLNFLNTEYLRNNTLVTSRNIYTSSSIKDEQ